MHERIFDNRETGASQSFDLFRLSKAKEVVDVCPNTLRAYHRAGLPFYRQGKAIFISKCELGAFIRGQFRGHGPVMT
jgi:hypothetical protein